jgi:hypothetical protein
LTEPTLSAIKYYIANGVSNVIIWSEKQYQAFLRKSGLQEPTTEKVEMPKVEPVIPIAPIASAAPKPHIVGNNGNGLVKATFLVCMTVIAVVGMVQHQPTDARPVAPVIQSHNSHIMHVNKKIHHRHKKSLTTVKPACKCNCIEKAKPITVEQVEERLTNE